LLSRSIGRAKTLIQVAVSIEDQAWGLQKAAGLDRITVGDHYLYDGILTWTEYLGAVPARHRTTKPGLTRMFAMARGVDGATALSKCFLVLDAPWRNLTYTC
jgi:hypothetical protein